MTDDRNNKSKPLARKHHIVPQSYLRRFASEDVLWVLDFHNRSHRESSVGNAAVIKDFYAIQTPERDKDDCVEDGLSRFGETQARPLIDQILDRHTFPQGKSWVEFVIFVALMYVRGPWLRQIMAERLDHAGAEMMDRLHGSPQVYQRSPLGQFTYEESLEIYNNIWNKVFPQIKRTAYVDFMLRNAKDYYQLFLRMTPNLIYVQPPGESIFVTSDRPVIAMPTKPGPKPSNMASSNVDIYFPLSSRACLILNWDSLPKAWAVGRDRVAYANYIQARNCSRLVMSQRPDFPWMRENRTISVDPVEMISTFADQKKNLPLVREYKGKKSRAKCLNDWSILRGQD
jgi:hypothetical protein